MRTRGALRAGWALLAAGLFLGGGRAAELGNDPWATGRDPDRYYERLDPDEFEEEMGEEYARYQRYGRMEGAGLLPVPLYRCTMNALESARYSAAELFLQRGDAKDAIPALNEVLQATKNDDVRDLTNFNLGNIYNHWLRDHDAAGKHYRQVTGLLRYSATRRLLNMLARDGKPDEAAKVNDELIAKAKEKGEKLALLHRLALVYKRNRKLDHALAVYKRIAGDFTPADMQEIAEGVEREVKAAMEKLHGLRRAEREEEAERLEDWLRERRPQELRAAGRWDELAAFEKAVERGFRRMEQAERARMEREDRDERAPEEGPPAKAEF